MTKTMRLPRLYDNSFSPVFRIDKRRYEILEAIPVSRLRAYNLAAIEVGFNSPLEDVKKNINGGIEIIAKILAGKQSWASLYRHIKQVVERPLLTDINYNLVRKLAVVLTTSPKDPLDEYDEAKAKVRARDLRKIDGRDLYLMAASRIEGFDYFSEVASMQFDFMDGRGVEFVKPEGRKRKLKHLPRKAGVRFMLNGKPTYIEEDITARQFEVYQPFIHQVNYSPIYSLLRRNFEEVYKMINGIVSGEYIFDEVVMHLRWMSTFLEDTTDRLLGLGVMFLSSDKPALTRGQVDEMGYRLGKEYYPAHLFFCLADSANQSIRTPMRYASGRAKSLKKRKSEDLWKRGVTRDGVYRYRTGGLTVQ